MAVGPAGGRDRCGEEEPVGSTHLGLADDIVAAAVAVGTEGEVGEGVGGRPCRRAVLEAEAEAVWRSSVSTSNVSRHVDWGVAATWQHDVSFLNQTYV